MGQTQEKLAEKLGVTPPRLRELEAGRANPSVLTLLRVGKALGVTVAALFEPPESRARPGPGRPPGTARQEHLGKRA